MSDQVFEVLREHAQSHDAKLEAVKSSFKQTNDAVNERLSEIEQKASRTAGGSYETKTSWGEQLVKSDRLPAFRESNRGVMSIEVKGAPIFTGGTGHGLVPRHSVVPDAVQYPKVSLNLRSVLLQGTTTSNLIEYPQLQSRVNNAAPVAEGADKPESELVYVEATAPVRTLAHLLPLSKQSLDDSQVVQSVVNTEMVYGLAEVEEAQILAGDGTGQNLHGLLPQATAFATPYGADKIAAPNMADAILAAIAQNATNRYDTDFIALNPVDIARLFALKDGQNRYLGTGPFTEADIIKLWQTPVVPSLAMPQGQFLVGSSRGAQIFDRQKYTVELSHDHADFFAKNLVMLRAESRLALAVYRPDAFIKGTFAAAIAALS